MLKFKGTLKIKKIIFSANKLISMLYCLLAMLFFPYAVSLNIPFYMILISAVLAIGIPILVMPYIYNLINGSPLIATGRYHIPLSISTLGMAFFAALLFAGRADMPYGANVCRILFSLMFVTLFFLIFKYVSSSVSARLFGENDKQLNFIGDTVSALGIASFILMFIFLFDGTIESISEIGYIVSIFIVGAGFLAYMSSFLDMPRFVRVESPKKRKIIVQYQKFFGSMSDKDNLKSYACYFLKGVSITVFFFATVYIGLLFTQSFKIIGIAMLVLGVFYILTSYFITKAAVNSLKKIVILSTALQFVTLSVFIVSAFVHFNGAAGVLILMAAASLTGVSGAAQVYSLKRGFDEVLSRSNSSKGIITIIYNLLLLLAVMTGLIVLSLSWIAPAHALKIALPVAAAFLAAATVLYFAPAKKLRLNLEYAADSDELFLDEAANSVSSINEQGNKND